MVGDTNEYFTLIFIDKQQVNQVKMIDPDLKQSPPAADPQTLSPDFPFHLHYEQFRLLYLSNKILQTKVQELLTERECLLDKLEKAERGELSLDNPESAIDDRKKRVRRVASEIKRHYECHQPGCNKSYGSEGSLNQHMKFKHPALYSQLFKDRVEGVESKENSGQSNGKNSKSESNGNQEQPQRYQSENEVYYKPRNQNQ